MKNYLDSKAKTAKKIFGKSSHKKSERKVLEKSSLGNLSQPNFNVSSSIEDDSCSENQMGTGSTKKTIVKSTVINFKY